MIMIRNKLTASIVTLFFASAPALAETLQIAAFGDSLTAGYGVLPEDSFPAQLEAWLQDKGRDVEVLNAGVSGETTAGGLARIDWALTDGLDGVIVELGANDLLRGLSPEAARDNLDGIMKAIAARDLPSLLAGMPAPQNYGADYKQAFDAIYVDLAAEYDAIYYRNFLQGIGEAGDLAAIGALMQSDGLHPNKEGVARVVDHIGPLVLELVDRIDTSE